MRCQQELCPNWSGDGNVCPCALFGIEPQTDIEELPWPGRQLTSEERVLTIYPNGSMPWASALGIVEMGRIKMHATFGASDE